MGMNVDKLVKRDQGAKGEAVVFCCNQFATPDLAPSTFPEGKKVRKLSLCS